MNDTPDPPPHPDDRRARLAASVAALRERFREVTLARAAEVEAAVLAQLEGALSGEARASAERAAHKLAGSLGTYGYPSGSRLAREIELLLGAPANDAGETLRLSDLVVALQREIERDPDRAPAGGVEGESPRIWIRSADEDLVARALMEAAGRGIAAARVRGAGLAGAVLAGGEGPRVIVFDLEGDPEAELADLGRLAHPGGDTALVLLAEAPSPPLRLAAGRAEVALLMEKPVSPLRLVQAAESLLRERSRRDWRVAALLSDEAHALRDGLAGQGMEVHPAATPGGVWPILESVRPDALLLDLSAGDEAVALCRAVRADPRWSWLPVLGVASASDRHPGQALLEAGADDLLPPEATAEAVARRIESRAARLRGLRAGGGADPLTGLWQAERLEEALARAIREAGRDREPLALAVVALDDLEGLRRRWGQGSADHALRLLAGLLRQSLREGDVLGRSGSGELTLALAGAGAADAALHLRGMAERLAAELERTSPDELRATFSAGVAEHPADGATAGALRDAALAALHGAEGPGSVALAGAAAPPADLLDVVVVEDDETIAGLLMHTLLARGYRAEWIADGAAAIQALTGPAPAMRGRVVLLDVDLPGRDGLSVLRALARDGLLERARVIMLTVRSGEREVLKAMEAGAFDHVAKPFSPQVLVHRIERALQART